MFGTKVLPATYYRSHCGNSLYYRTSRDHELYTLLYNLSQCPVHYPVKFDADIFIQSGVIDVFLFTYLKSKMAAAAIWIFRLCEFGYSGVMILWYLCSVPNLVRIYVIVTEIDALMLLTFF